MRTTNLIPYSQKNTVRSPAQGRVRAWAARPCAQNNDTDNPHMPTETITSPPFISVITPALPERANIFLPACLDSVAKQILPKGWTLEHIICFSNTPLPPETYKHITTTYPHTRIIHTNRNGVSAARNDAFLTSQGNIIIDLDDDDMLPATSIRNRVTALLETNHLWAYGDLMKIDEQGRYIPGADVLSSITPTNTETMMKELITGKAYAWSGTRTYHRTALLKAGPWDETFPTAEDYEHWLRLTAIVGHPLAIQQSLAFFRQKENSLGINTLKDGTMQHHRQRATERWVNWTPQKPLPHDLPTWNNLH